MYFLSVSWTSQLHGDFLNFFGRAKNNWLVKETDQKYMDAPIAPILLAVKFGKPWACLASLF